MARKMARGVLILLMIGAAAFAGFSVWFAFAWGLTTCGRGLLDGIPTSGVGAHLNNTDIWVVLGVVGLGLLLLLTLFAYGGGRLRYVVILRSRSRSPMQPSSRSSG